MSDVGIDVEIVPAKLRAFARNEALMTVSVRNNGQGTYWCECEIALKPPLSLANDSEMNSGRIRIGILKPATGASKPVKLYTRPNNYPDDYQFSVTGFVYDEGGAIAERVERKASIACLAEPTTQAQTAPTQPQA